MKSLMLILLSMSMVMAAPENKGDEAFDKGDFAKAVEHYQKALETKTDDLMLKYNLGTAMYKAGNLEESVNILREVAIRGDQSLAKKAWYNSANVLFRKAMGQNEIPKKIAGLKESIVSYKEMLKVKFDDSKLNHKGVKNLEFAQLKLKEAIDQQKENQQQDDQDQKDQPKPSEEAKKVLAKAMSLTAQGLYDDAVSLLSDIIEKDETASNYKSHLQRLEDLSDISKGIRPERNFDHSNLDEDMEVI